MSKVKIITDSTCDLPAELVEQYDIRVIPCYVNMGSESYLDGVELSRQEFFQKLPDQNPIPTTSAPGIGSFIESYQQLASEGATGIISIHISHTLSNIVNVARLAAENFSEIPVKVIDSGQLSMGLGLLALVGAKLASTGADLYTVENAILEKKPLTNAFAKLETLDYLRRGGRLSSIQHSIVSLLDIKPITKMSNGLSGMELIRTRKKAYNRLIEIASELGPPEYVGIIHANAPELVIQVSNDLKRIWPDVTPLISWVTPAIGAHVGPGTICIACIQKQINRPLFDSRLDQLKNKVNAIRTHMPGTRKDS
jgi:DegV family protein with EDD domain